MSVDASIIAYAVKYNDMTTLQGKGITVDSFVDEYRTVWRYMLRIKRDHDSVVSADTLQARFPDLALPRVRKSELPHLITTLYQRNKYIAFLKTLNTAVEGATSYEQVDDIIQQTQGALNQLAYQGGAGSHLVDAFSKTTNRRMVKEVQRRRSGATAGLPTGLRRIDTELGGMQKKRMYTIIGRSGLGKSWVDLLFLASGVMAGGKFILYPLEMSLEETLFRLYTIFSQKMFGMERVLKNYDLSTGRVTKRNMVRFLNVMEDRFPGQLYVADVASLSDQYTIERIESEVEVYQPDGFWVDYLTLLKPPAGAKNDREDIMIRHLSNGIAGIAKRRNCIGGASAQVNREAVRNNVFLPRIEHIGYGDAIGQDSDVVVSINRKGEYLHYAVPKNRGGPEIGTMNKHGIRVKFFVNEGVIEEAEDQGEDED